MYTGLGDGVDNLNEQLIRTKELMGLLNEQNYRKYSEDSQELRDALKGLDQDKERFMYYYKW